jgi:hypothetical protein
MILAFSSVAFPFALASNSETDRRLDVLERDNSSIHAEHYQIMQQVSTDTKALSDLIEIVNKHHAEQSDYPALLATLDVKLTWILRGIGAVLLGGIGWMWNRVRYSNKVAEELRRHAELVIQRQDSVRTTDAESHQGVMDELQLIKVEAHSAYKEANTVNQKIAGIGQDLKYSQEHPPPVKSSNL